MNRFLALMACGAFLGAAAALSSPPAHADPSSYLQSLSSHGLNVYDQSAALATGYRICSMLNVANGEQVAEYVFTHTSWSDVPTIDVARAEVIIAVQELCPAQDHSGRATSAGGSIGGAYRT